MEQKVDYEDGTKLSEYQFRDNSIMSSRSSSPTSRLSEPEIEKYSEISEKNNNSKCKFTIVTETQVEDKATYMSETDEYYPVFGTGPYQDKLTRTTNNRIYKSKENRPRSNSSTISPTGKYFLKQILRKSQNVDIRF